MTIAFRLRAHAKIASKFIGSDEEIKYVFVAQKNYQSYEIDVYKRQLQGCSITTLWREHLLELGVTHFYYG